MSNAPAPITPFCVAVDQTCPHGYNHCNTCDDARLHEQAMRVKMFAAVPFNLANTAFEAYVGRPFPRPEELPYQLLWEGVVLSTNTIGLKEVDEYPPHVLAQHWLGALAAVYSKIKQSTADTLTLYNTGEKHKNTLRDQAQRDAYLKNSVALATALAEKQRAEYARPCLELLGVVGRDELLSKENLINF